MDDLTTMKIDAVVTDPPYGCSNDCDYSRFTRGKKPSTQFKQIANDEKPFDPTWLLQFPKVLMFGYQFFATHLPVGSILVWNKKRESQQGKYLSDAELAWMNSGKGVYIFNHIWCGFDRQSERGEKTKHPTQKPVAVMEWMIGKLKLKPGSTILDPYMGSGSTGLAAKNLGFNFVGVELDKDYFEIAHNRINQS